MAKPKQAVKMTPMMKQYLGVKRQYPDALLFFRMGDFFELFYEDAKIANRVLGIALTSRSKEADMPMAGVPARSAENYLHRLIRAGHTVVICDQVEDPKQAKGIVERAVTRVVTAGTVLEDALLEGGQHNYLAALTLPPSEHAETLVGLSWLDLSTARFEGMTCTLQELPDEWNRLAPAEVLLPEEARDSLPAGLAFLDDGQLKRARSYRPLAEFDLTLARDRLCRHFGVSTLRGFGVSDKEAFVGAAGALLAYVQETQRGLVQHLCQLRQRTTSEKLKLDRPARLALELFETAHERRREGSLLWCIDRTLTAAGSRLLRDWLGEPLIQLESIQQRQDAVHNLFEDPSLRAALREELRGISDIERITSRLSARRTHPRDLAQLRDSLLSLPRLRATLDGVTSSSLLKQIRSQLEAPPGLAERLTEALETAPPLNLKEGGYIRAGYSKDLDELRALRSNSKDLLAALQQRESERTGIPNLKVGYNSVFGYYIEITNSHKDRAPDDYIRKQTLKNAERYITPELKEHEGRVLSAEERALSLEQELFEQVRQEAAQHVAALQELAHQIAQLDVLGALAEVSVEQSFVRPQMDDSTALEIEAGCHPVLARTLGRQHFVPNDCHLGGKRAPFAVITGPNMAGKSTYLRQTALLVLLAQMGCFVPARRARIGVVDQIFTRVGAADDLARGASTFMVEMTETANILHHATPRSLVILDEIGRGTGTFDGLSLARAVSEHLAEQVHCRALFATHYHQLTQLAEEFESVCNLTVAVREWGEEIVFLHEILPGGTDRSYGIQVARLAGIPRSVLARAQTLLRELEATDLSPKQARDQEPEIRPPESAAAETAVHKVIQRLRRLDVDRLTPLEALNFLARMQTELDRTHARLQRTRRRPQGPSLFDTATGAGG